MKRNVLLSAFLVAVAVCALAVYAQQRQRTPGDMMQRPGARQGGMQGMMGGMMQQGEGMMQCPCPMMANGMNEQEMVATEDGVIVMAGGKLIKYNNNLEKIKEVEIPVDMEAMQQKMQKMMQSCPMHRQMMDRMQGMQQDAMEGMDTEAATDQGGAAAPAEGTRPLRQPRGGAAGTERNRTR